MASRAVVWFRRELRGADHPALLAALDAADQVVPVFVVDRTLLDGRPSGPNRRAFLHGALQALARDLEALGGRLIVLEGDPVSVIPALARQAAADTVWCSREHTPYAHRRATAPHARLLPERLRRAPHARRQPVPRLLPVRPRRQGGRLGRPPPHPQPGPVPAGPDHRGAWCRAGCVRPGRG